MYSNWLPYANFSIQCLLFVVLTVYTVETWKIRKISRDQVETLQKPCLTLAAAKRQFADVVLRIGGTESAQIVAPSEGMLQLVNVGLGPAFNIRYTLIPEESEATGIRPSGYLIHILLRESATIACPVGVLNRIKWNFAVYYDSLTGRGYETKITIDDQVLTKVTHRDATRGTSVCVTSSG